MNRKEIAHLIQTDFSRLVPGDWFVPLVWQGEDQHRLLPAARSKGIAGYIRSQDLTADAAEVLHGLPGEYQPDLRKFVFTAAEEHREQLSLRATVITGSNGKTTVKEMLAAILKTTFGSGAFMSPDNQNTKLALATQILRMPHGISHAVFEVGARRTGDFRIPLRILKPECAVLLNVGTAHVGEFGSAENLRHEKLSVLDCETLTSAAVFGDDAGMMQTAQKRGLPFMTFGKQPHNDVRLVQESFEFVRLYIAGRVHDIRLSADLPCLGLNTAAAVAAALCMQIPIAKIKQGLQEFRGVGRRFQRLQRGSLTLIDDAFNASPESMREGLLHIKNQHRGRKMTFVLGSMLELGDACEAEHRDLARWITQTFAEDFANQRLKIILIGEEMRPAYQTLSGHSEDVQWFPDRKASEKNARAVGECADIVYFKASKSVGLLELIQSF